MRKAFKSSEGMTKVREATAVDGSGNKVETNLLNEDRNWQMIVWRFDKWLNEQTKVPKKILDEWKGNIKRY